VITMSERDLDAERRLRRAAVSRHAQVPPEAADPPADRSTTGDARRDADEAEDAAAQRMEQKALWVDFQIRRAMERGDFDDLPGAGKPLDLPDRHDPDWWVKRLIEREKLSGIAPPAIGLRREDAELDDLLDREAREEGVRRVVDDFNRRVVDARRQLTGGPPVITRTRDAEEEVQAWRARRAAAARLAQDRARERERERRQAEEAARAARPSLLRRVVLRSRTR
jgi:hypothetical protein